MFLLRIWFLLNCRVVGGSLAGVHPKVVAAHFDYVGFDAYRLIHHQLTGGYVILPAVPGTRNRDSMEFSLPQRSSPVQASVMDGVELVANVRYSQSQAINLKFADGPCGDVVFPCGAHKGHSQAPSKWEYQSGYVTLGFIAAKASGQPSRCA